jgi:hypothetical protein
MTRPPVAYRFGSPGYRAIAEATRLHVARRLKGLKGAAR